jgi:hypothetical protein
LILSGLSADGAAQLALGLGLGADGATLAGIAAFFSNFMIAKAWRLFLLAPLTPDVRGASFACNAVCRRCRIRTAHFRHRVLVR